jgi:hypothetical protein
LRSFDQPRRDEAERDEQRPDDEGEDSAYEQSGHPHVAPPQFVQVDSQPEDDERDDLTEAGQCGVEAFDLAFVGCAFVTEQDAGDEDGQEP